jgi:putative endonuclease
MTNKFNRVLYTGVTGNINRRVFEHKEKLVKGFTSRYNLHKMVYCEEFNDVFEAIQREKQIKGWLRKKKRELIRQANPTWRDLSNDLY